MTTSSRKKMRAIVLGIFDKRQHNRQYMRLIWRYLPGYYLRKFGRYPAMKSGHLYIVQYLLEQKGELFGKWEANYTAECGHLHILKYFAQCKDYYIANPLAVGSFTASRFMSPSANIGCSTDGANSAAAKGHLHIVQWLQTQNIYCDENGLYNAIARNRISIVSYLLQSGVHCEIVGANMAKIMNYTEILEILKQYDIFPSENVMSIFEATSALQWIGIKS